MPRDTQITATSTEAAPKDYTIPKNAEVLLRSVKATFTDNGAAGNWLPACVLISDSGHKIVQALDRGVEITAGSDAEVSWFPGVKGAGAAAAGTFPTYCFVVLGSSTPSGTVSNPLGGTAMPITSFETGDPADFQQVDGFSWTVPSKAMVIAGYMTTGGGAPTVTNGDVTCWTHKSGGFGLGAFAPSGVKVVNPYFSYVLGRTVERGGTWSAYAAGADTHTWDMTITYFTLT